VDHRLHDPQKERHDYYVARAVDAEKQAQACVDPQARQSWQRVAEGWRELANQLLRMSRL
jgi:hypothetical protein